MTAWPHQHPATKPCRSGSGHAGYASKATCSTCRIANQQQSHDTTHIQQLTAHSLTLRISPAGKHSTTTKLKTACALRVTRTSGCWRQTCHSTASECPALLLTADAAGLVCFFKATYCRKFQLSPFSMIVLYIECQSQPRTSHE